MGLLRHSDGPHSDLVKVSLAFLFKAVLDQQTDMF